MKKLKYVLAFAVLLGLGFAYSCKTSNECRAIITVVTTDATGAKVNVPDCQLTIGDTSFSDDVYRSVVTDENGQYEGVWKYDAYLKVTALKTINNRAYKGVAFIRLNNGETTEQEILLKQS